MTIYLDTVWLLNLIFDLMLLMLTKGIARFSAPAWRIWIGALVASFIVPILFIFPDSFVQSVLFKVIYSFIIIFCAFGFHSIFQFLKLFFIFYFVTFSIGGGLIAVHYLFSHSITGNGFLVAAGHGDPISWVFVLVGFPLSYLFTKHRMNQHIIDKIRYEQLYTVTIQIKNEAYTTTAYVDSGNHLTDPISKKPVVICDEPFLKQWFSNEDWESLKKAADSFDMDLLPEEWEHLIHFIPYQGVNGNGVLLAIRPEACTIHETNRTLRTRKFLIGVRFGELAKDGTYHCLLQPQIMQFADIHSA